MSTNCELIHTVSYHPLYRGSQVFTFAVSLFAMFPILRLIFSTLPKTTFHQNVKFLFMVYFAQVLISTANDTIAFMHHVIIPFLAVYDCDLLIKPSKWIVFQYIGVFGISCSTLTNLGITIERLLAFIWAGRYETTKPRIGVWIGFVTVALDVGIVVVLFRDEKFDNPSMSYFMAPETSGKGMNCLCWSLLFINILNLLFNMILVRVNVIFRDIWRNTLSTRFQMEENVLTNKFSTCISFLHVFFFLLYLGFTLLIRLVVPHFLTTESDLLVLRGLYITIPTYHVVVGLASCWILEHLREQKRARVYTESKYKGSEGAMIHEKAILSIWYSTKI